MKNLSLFTLASLLTTTAATALNAAETIDCAKIPTCDELGYTDIVAQCPSRVIKCPFDQTKGLCQHAAEIGEIGYFPYIPGKGWLKCDGKYYNKERYPDLYAKLTTTFGGSGDIFRVPDYQGDFVRVYGGSSNSVTVRQEEGLPNITGTFWTIGNFTAASTTPTKAFSWGSKGANLYDHGDKGGDGYDGKYTFDASNSNSIYGSSYHVTPVNTSVYAYIYAGRVDSDAPLPSTAASSCTEGNYLYTDGTCSASYTSSKTVKGIVQYTNNSSTSAYIRYIRGGTSSMSSGKVAENSCKSAGEILASSIYFTSLPASISTSQSVVSSVQAGKYYWHSTTSKVKCTSQTSCTSSSDTATSGTAGSAYQPYYYCYGYMYFGN